MLTFQPATGEEHARISSAASELRDYALTSAEFLAALLKDVPPDSQLTQAYSREGGGWAYDGAVLKLSGAQDHLLAVSRLLASGEFPRYALHTLIRAPLEGAARAAWLLEPGISDSRRLARGMTERLANLLEVQRLGHASHARNRMNELTKAAMRRSVPPTKDKKGRLLGFGSELRPDATKLLGKLLPETSPTTNGLSLGEFAYRSLSGRSHSSLWALIYNAQPIGRPRPGVTLAAMTASLDEVFLLLTTAVRVHHMALDLLARATGGRLIAETPSFT